MAKNNEEQEAREHSDSDDDLAIRWRAPKFIFYKKDGRWYGIVIGTSVALLALAWFLQEALLISIWLLVPVVVLGVVALLSRSAVQPPIIEYALTEDGIMVGDRHYAYADFRSFSVIDMDNHYVLRLWPKTRYLLPLTILLSDEVIPADIKEILSELLPEGDHEATLADWIAHYTRF